MRLFSLVPLPPHLHGPAPASARPFAASALHSERGLEFDTGDAFFRSESATGRDLGVLAAALHMRANGGRLRVLDAMCGCGVRSLRYLAQSGADFVWANDANEETRKTILDNLGKEARVAEDGRRRWLVTHTDAIRVMLENSLNREFFDFIDVDSFGSDSAFLRPALEALSFGGLLYVTSTDGYSSGGHRPQHSLASYGAYIRSMPYCNELGLRMLIGGAQREASTLGYYIKPLFSYYSYHGPVFRVVLQVNRGKLPDNRHYGFTAYCNLCGNSRSFSWSELGHINCPCGDGKVSYSLVVSGPLWTGPIHDGDYVNEMLKLAKQWGWADTGQQGKEGVDLEKLLTQMINESDPALPCGFIKLDEVASRGKVNSPPLQTMMNVLHQAGYAASRSHIVSNAIKTNCPMTVCVKIARELQRG